MCGATASTCSRSSRRITPSARTTRGVRASRSRRPPIRRSGRSTGFWTRRRRRSCTSEGRHGPERTMSREPSLSPASRPSPKNAAAGVPAHVAIIMDGNGRWAARRGLPRAEGHRRGVEAIRRAVRSATDLGIRYLTVYSFSSENWRRPAQEVADLMGLLKRFVRHDLADLHRANVRVRIIGERDGLAPDIRALLQEAEGLTRENTGLTLVVAFNYGGA